MYLAGRSCRWCVALDRWRVLSGDGRALAGASRGPSPCKCSRSGLDDERTADDLEGWMRMQARGGLSA